ncbi:Mechanosensitive ion channel family protein [Hyphomicrobiales bacterium]|nr:Mechanosensitive ion channel family protein [Hyphomicrobiales bacterium]CAH1701506.1 Mechanosensitive ion channel family protein [Hyphomicrobiales bacterium]CAI0345463.1 moderate conductance mechanosensitive channel [Hyphomicrobiales bacterium]
MMDVTVAGEASRKRPEARFLIRLAIAAVMLGMSATGAVPAEPARAETQAPIILNLRGDETPEAIRRMVEALSAPGRQVEIRVGGAGATPTAAAPAAPPEPAAKAKPAGHPSLMMDEEGLQAEVEALVDRFVDGVEYGSSSIPSISQLPGDWEQAWQRNLNGRNGPTAGWRIVGILCLALAIALAFRFGTRRWFARRQFPSGPEFTPRLVASSWGLLQDVATVVIALGVARIARNAWLPENDLAMITLSTGANGIAIGALYIAVGRFLLSPRAPERRIMPLPRAQRHFRLLIAYSIITPLVVTGILLAHHVSSGPRPVTGLIALTGLAVTLFKLWWFYNGRHDLTALVLSGSSEPGPIRRAVATGTAWFYMAVTVILWMVSSAAAMMSNGGRWAEASALTQAAIVIVPIIAVGLSSLLRCHAMRREAEQGVTPMRRASSAALRAAAVGVIWAIGFFILARLWAGLLLGVSSGQFAGVMRQIAGVAVFAFAGWVALVFLHAFFDAYTPKRRVIGPADEDSAHEEGVPSRLGTVLPVLRGVVLGAVLGLTVLVVLSRLGVDIGPLLAGFGILGLAISFGSQALVRDIVSGVFFMLEDAFRVGEYVDTGRLKGTVEKISLRSMQLRHQSGQIHTVPFGQVQSLTNASRDWATVKFNVRLDHSADIEQARKAIKKTGIALMEDPEFGPHFIAPLKMQGVADIVDSAIVVRLKFTGKPSQASMLQREALKRVYRALNEARIPFASNAVTVRGGERGAQAGAAAAISTVPPPTPLAAG